MWGVPPAEAPRGKGETYTVTARSPKREIGGDTPTVMAGSPKREKPENVVTGRYRPQAVGHCWTPTFDCHTIRYGGGVITAPPIPWREAMGYRSPSGMSTRARIPPGVGVWTT